MKQLLSKCRKFTYLLAVVILLELFTGCGAEGGKNTDVETSKYSKEAQSFAEEVQAGNYTDAIDVYNNKLYGNAALENEASLFLQDFLFENLDLFNQETITETEFSNVLMSVQKVDDTLHIITFALTDAQEQFNILVDSKANYKNGLEYMDEEDYLTAADCFACVSSLDMNYEPAQSRHDDAMNNFSQQIIKSAEEKISNGEYQTAIGIIDNASQYTDWLSEYDELLSKAYTMEAEESVNNALTANNYAAAQNSYNSYLDNEYVVFSADMIMRLEEAKTNYRISVKEDAQLAADADDYAGALIIIEGGLEVLENDSELLQFQTEMQKNYEDYLVRTTPVSLAELDSYQNKHIDRSCDIDEDIFGNEYYSHLATNSVDASATYRIDGIYKTFTGAFYIRTDYNETPRKVSIYGDGSKLFEATVNGGEDPITFNIDISGVRDLTINMEGYLSWATCLGDPILTP